MAGLNTVLVDKGRFGSGSTSASTALVSYEFDLTLSELSDRLGKQTALQAYRLCYEATAQIKELVHKLGDLCDYDDKVAVRVTNNLNDYVDLKRETSLRNRHHFKVELLERSELQSRYGVTAALGLVAHNAAQIDPLKLTRKLVGQASSHGLRAFEESRVTSFESGKLEVKVSTAPGGTVRAKHAIFATGYESEKYLGRTKAKLTTDFCFISHPIRTLDTLQRCHLLENLEDYLYLSTFGDRVMVGIEGKSFRYPGERSRLMDKRTREILERVEQYLPGRKISPEYRWASTFANSPDSLPYIGTTSRLPGAYFALGYGGNGIASSAMLAPILVDLVLKGKSRDGNLFRLDR